MSTLPHSQEISAAAGGPIPMTFGRMESAGDRDSQIRNELAVIMGRAQACAADLQAIMVAARQLLQVAREEPGEVAREEASSPGETTVAGSRSVLYIEDDAVNFDLVRRILAARTHLCVEQATSGEAGLDAAVSGQPALILLDLNLPDIHGMEVLRRLRENPRTRHIPVIVISADATASQIERLLAAGARDYLVKPFNIHRFLALHDTVFEEIERKQHRAAV